jgi:hypothetical protein
MDGLKLAIGGPHGWHGTDAAVLPVDAKSPLWAGLTDGKAVKLYEATSHVGIKVVNPPADVVLLGREEVSKQHYPLIRQDRFVLWGFTDGPDALRVRELSVIHRYESLKHLNQRAFVLDRPHSRLAKQYRRLTRG